MDIDPIAGPSRTYHVPESVYRERVLPVNDYRPAHAGSSCPLIIDNGSSQLRAGWGDEEAPRVIADQVIARYRDRKTNRTLLLVGGDTEVDATSRSSAKPVFEGDVLTNFELMEHALDHAFLNLGLDTETVEHPILMTERLATPLASRAMMSELLFEGYNAPSVAYGVDSLFAFAKTGLRDGLALGMGNQSTTLIPVVDGRGVLSSARRLAWGGAQAQDLLQRLVQLKYPGFPNRILPYQATFMARESCYFADDFAAEVRAMADPEKLAEKSIVMQFPFTAPVVEEKSAEELARQAEKRKESGRRLQEIQQKARLEKIITNERELAELKEVKAAKETLKKADYQKRIENAGFEDERELDTRVKKIEEYLRRTRKKDLGEFDEPAAEEPTFPLVDRPDAELTEDEIKEKRKQKLFKSGYDARMKIKAEKAAEKARVEEEERKDEAARLADPQQWASKLREEQEAVILRINERKRKKSALGDRKSAAAQSRMKNIADLAADGPAPKKKRRGNDDDGFGSRDDDWAVYREIDGIDLEEEEEEDLAYLASVEAKLLQHDPSFTAQDTHEAKSTQQNALLAAFLRGGSDEAYSADNIEQSFQVHLNVERSRVPETWFQPHLAGLDSAGLGEIIGHILRELPAPTQARVQRGIFATGGSTAIPGLRIRLENELRPILPYKSEFKVLLPPKGEERIDAWKGMAAYSRTEEFRRVGVTRAEYDEYGGEYIKEGAWSNWRSG